MALLTGGTNANSSLEALLWGPAISASNVALFNVAVKDDQNVNHPSWPGALIPTSGLLTIPNRGRLQILPGDYVMVDATTGWPILLSARAIASGPWAHS
jgi:hypothetical protein